MLSTVSSVSADGAPWYCAFVQWLPPESYPECHRTPTPTPPTPTPVPIGPTPVRTATPVPIVTVGPALVGALPWFSIQRLDNRRILDLLNQFRGANGSPAMTYNPNLNAAAQRFAQYLSETGQFTHNPSDGSGLGDRDDAAGYRGWARVGENLTAGSPTIDLAFQNLVNSAAHRSEMLLGGYRDLGIGWAHIEPGTPFTDLLVMELGCSEQAGQGQCIFPSLPEGPRAPALGACADPTQPCTVTR